MASKTTGAAGATKNTVKTTGTKLEAVKTFKKLGDALVAFDNGEMPKGTTLEIGATSTRITRKTKLTREVFYLFNGTPAQFAEHVLKRVVNLKMKVELVDGQPPPAEKLRADDGE